MFGCGVLFLLSAQSDFHILWLGFAGGLCNLIAMIANGDRMPYFGVTVDPNNPMRCVGNDQTRLHWLCKRIPDGDGGVGSIGDVLLLIGVLGMLWQIALLAEFPQHIVEFIRHPSRWF
jgi:hypothetical protein